MYVYNDANINILTINNVISNGNDDRQSFLEPQRFPNSGSNSRILDATPKVCRIIHVSPSLSIVSNLALNREVVRPARRRRRRRVANLPGDIFYVREDGRRRPGRRTRPSVGGPARRPPAPESGRGVPAALGLGEEAL